MWKYNPSEIDEYFMSLAIKEAKKAFKKKEVPIGAIIVLDNEIVAKAYNKVESNFDPTAHAEIIAIKRATKKIKNWRLTGATLYVTKEPCVMCAGAMVSSRISRLVYGCKDTKRGAVHSIYHILSDRRLNHQVKILSGVLEDKCAELLKEFFYLLR
jgi:tRNA(adenine34) deaminase